MPAKTKAKKKKKISKTAKPKPAKKKSLKAKRTGRKPITAKTRKPARKPSKPAKKKVAAKRRRAEPKEFSVNRSEGRKGRLSGDLQGLSQTETAGSESVAELLEEGNTFEAEILSGVEAADADENEVQTHEVPEDDVPGEYLDED
jgi:hypothetical protein